MNISIFFPFFTTFLITLVFMPLVIYLAKKWNFTDNPRGRDEFRRLQKISVANGGGIILYLALAIAIFLFFPIWKPLIAVLICGLILVVAGTADDFRELPWWLQIIPHLLVAVIIAFVGIRINYVSNPFGGTLDLTVIKWLPILLTILWIVIMINTVKFLDGVDGLSSGVGFIAAMTLGGLSVIMLKESSYTAPLAFALAGGLLGYLIWNWYPAKVYYGEAGAALTGFMLAVLAIFSGGKIATAFLIMGLPVLDIIRLVIVRLKNKRKPWQAGRDHLHHLLYDAGLGARGTVIVLYLFSLIFGAAALFLQTKGKIILAGVVLIIMLILTWILNRCRR
ncbi:MAG: MraY family glycosyltransferase [Patescibacteria group bacterium]|nr:MraY family glycosyltransferase [Patescibacteria group bacterium]